MVSAFGCVRCMASKATVRGSLKRGSVSISYPLVFVQKLVDFTFFGISPSSVIRLGSNFTGNLEKIPFRFLKLFSLFEPPVFVQNDFSAKN